MISIEALSAFIALAIIILFMVIFHVELSNTTSIDKICSLLISTALAIFLAVLYFIEVRDNYLNDLLENNNKILASETTCNIDYITSQIDVPTRSLLYFAWYSYQNISQGFFHCKSGPVCLLLVNTTIVCWSDLSNHYYIEAPLTNTNYIYKHYNWGIAQIVLTIIGCMIPLFRYIYKLYKHNKQTPVCSICLIAYPNIMFNNCYHICLCESCNTVYNSLRCPICAQLSSNTIKVYYS